MEVTDSRPFLNCHHLHTISVSISSPESDSALTAVSSAIAHFERLQETTSQCALILCHALFPVLHLPSLLCRALSSVRMRQRRCPTRVPTRYGRWWCQLLRHFHCVTPL